MTNYLYKFIFIFLVINLTACSTKEDQKLIGDYYNIKNMFDLTIKETRGFDTTEYVLTEYELHKLGRFDTAKNMMTVFVDIRPDNFDYHLIFSKDFNFVYSATDELLYVKKNYYNSLSSKQKKTLK